MTAKTIRFLRVVPPDDEIEALAASARPGEPGSPSRAVLRTVLTLPGLPPPEFAAVEVRWFTPRPAGRGGGDPTGPPAPASVVRGPDGIGAGPGTSASTGTGTGTGEDTGTGTGTGEVVVPVDEVVVPVDEVVARGADALRARWADGGERYVMMSFGRRNPALTRAEFVGRWQAEAGRLGGDPIPDDLRGLAYVQDHPVGDDPPFDAINEVWFDDVEGVRRRAEWFAARPVPAELMDPETCRSLVLRETLVHSAPRPRRPGTA